MILIPAGQYIMGDNGGEDDEKPTHKVQLASFYMDKYEITQKGCKRMMGKNPAKFKDPNNPVERVSWLNAIRYCNMRSLREGLTPCYNPSTLECNFDADGYRLPTEAEWEYACRAGTKTKYYFSNLANNLGQYAWYKTNANSTTHPVGKKKPNPWGLYDMHGNVWEWCNDYYAEKYDETDTANPEGPDAGDERVLRGGGFTSTAKSCRSAARFSEPPGFADVCFGYEAYGFRCVKRASEDNTRK